MKMPSWRSSHLLIYTGCLTIRTENLLRAGKVFYSPATSITMSLVNIRQLINICKEKKKEKSGLRKTFSNSKIYLLVLIFLHKLNNLYFIKTISSFIAKPLYELPHIPEIVPLHQTFYIL